MREELRKEITRIFGAIMAEINVSNRTIIITNSNGHFKNWHNRIGYSTAHEPDIFQLYYSLKGSILMETNHKIEVIDQYFEPMRVVDVKETDGVLDIRTIVGRLAIEEIPFYKIINKSAGVIIIQVPDQLVPEMTLRSCDIEDSLGLEVEVKSLKESCSGELIFQSE